MTLANLQLAVVDVIATDRWIINNGIRVLAEDQGNIAAELDTALAKLGLAVVVYSPGIVGNAPSSPVPQGLCNIVVACYETPLLNRGKANRTTALNAAERVACRLTGLFTGMPARRGNRVFGPPSFVKLEFGGYDNKIFYTVHFQVLDALDGDMAEFPPESTSKHPIS